MFEIGSVRLAGPLVLAPMAGYTDTAARRLARREGATLVVSEMVSAAGLVRNSKNTRSLLAFHPEEKPLGIQIFGNDPGEMAEAARMVQGSGASLVDINMGCPVKKVCRHGAGSALLRDPPLAGRILQAVRKAVQCPVTVKMRLGWDSRSISYLEIARIAEQSGIQAITLHPRTRSQGFRGTADWTCVGRVAQQVRIPVIGSGDIVTPEDGAAALRSGVCDGVMIGRASRGNPWLFSQTQDLLDGSPPREPEPEERYETVVQHLEWVLSNDGKEKGWKRSRFLLLHYGKNLPRASWFRKQMFSVHDEASLRILLREYFLFGAG